MNRHKLTYVDLHPEPVNTDEPSTLSILAGAVVTLAALWCAALFLFTL